MEFLKRLGATIMRELWYYRSEGLYLQFKLMSDKAARIKETHPSYAKVQDRYERVATKLQMADDHYWYWAQRS